MADAEKVSYWKFRLTPDGPEYELQRSDLTMGVLRQFKQWFGPQYGKFLTFTQLLLEGDAEAWACAIWLVQRNAGEKPRNPQYMDFAIGDLMFSAAEDEEAEAREGGASEEEGEEPDPLPEAATSETTHD